MMDGTGEGGDDDNLLYMQRGSAKLVAKIGYTKLSMTELVWDTYTKPLTGY